MTFRPKLVLDFDGVVHSYTSGWKGADVVSDPPVPGALEFIRAAQEHFEVSIFSSRSNQAGGAIAMGEWLHLHMLHVWGPDEASRVFNDIAWPFEKPAAFVTIDDRALTFDGTWPSLESLKAFKPWNR